MGSEELKDYEDKKVRYSLQTKRTIDMTLTEKILAEHAHKSRVEAGENVWVDVDTLMTHDVCGPGTIGIFKKEFGKAKVWNREKVVIIPDHYIFTADPHAKRNLDILRDFVREQEIPHFFDAGTERYRGVCHVTLAEEGFIHPGHVLFGTDSHTCTAGAFGAFASGIGNTDAAFVMGTGKLWVKIPATLKFILEGTLPSYVMAKDVILRIIGDIGIDGATYCAMEFEGEAISLMNMDERMTLCNMVIEAGAKNGIIAFDTVTLEYMKSRTGRAVYPLSGAGPSGNGVQKKVYRSADLDPVAAEPFSPDRVKSVRKLRDISLDQCYIGSCTGGKLTDFRAAAGILKEGTVKVRTVIVPATTHIESALNKERIEGRTLKDIFQEAGAEIGPPSCAACLGGPEDTFGRLNGNAVCLSTTNRNVPGRMGSLESRTYLASPLTVAASALKGKITDPREFLL